VSVRTPSYRLHKPSGQAVVTLNGRDHSIGKYGSVESRAEYDRLLAEWLARGRQTPAADPRSDPAALTVSELLLAYVRFADGYYVKNGKPTSEAGNVRLALRPLRPLYGHTPARDFGPLALKAVRAEMVRSDLCRTEVNKRVRHVVRVFKWGVGEELVPPSVHHGLRAVSGLRRGRSDARESEPVKPVPDAFVDAVRPHVSRQVWAMIELQRLTGMRPGEACAMRTGDLDTSGRVWVYRPAEHKTEHHGKERLVYLGPRAQAVVRPWLRTDLGAYLFSPREAMEEYRAALRANRKTPMTPSQAARTRKRKPRKAPGERYSTESYGRAIAGACKRAGVPGWHPHQLRHNAATMLRKEFRLDVARVILGHSSPVVTEVYAEVDKEKAVAVMERVG
jgi:integrase